MSILGKAYNFIHNHLVFNYFRFITRRKIRKYEIMFQGKVLDIGCGEKPYKRCFTRITEYQGTNSGDYYKHMIPDETDLVVNDGCKLPVGDEIYDGVLCFQVLPVFEDMGVFFTEVRRVLKPQGLFMISSDFLYPVWNAPFNFWRTTGFGLEVLARRSGFNMIFTEDYGGFWAMLARVFPRYIKGLMFKSITRLRHAGMILKMALILKVLFILIFTMLSPVVLNIFILFCHVMDILFRDRDFTTNYLAVMKK